MKTSKKYAAVCLDEHGSAVRDNSYQQRVEIGIQLEGDQVKPCTPCNARGTVMGIECGYCNGNGNR